MKEYEYKDEWEDEELEDDDMFSSKEKRINMVESDEIDAESAGFIDGWEEA